VSCAAKVVDTPYAVRDQVVVMNGENDRAYTYVCVKCIKGVAEALDDLFPNNKYAVRARDQAKAYEKFAVK